MVQDIRLNDITPVGRWIIYRDGQLSEPVIATFKDLSTSYSDALERTLGRKPIEKSPYSKGIFGELKDGTKVIVANVIHPDVDPDQYKEELGKFFYDHPEVSNNVFSVPLVRIYIVTPKIEKEAKLVRRYNKNRKRTEWALVSRSNPKKVLRWFGSHKPSKQRLVSEERRVQWFKHKGSIKNAWLIEEIPIVERKDEHPFTKDDVEVKRKWVSGPKDHLERKDVFGPHTDTEFGSGLLKKDKELYPRWEFTETFQFRQNAQDITIKEVEKYGPYNPLLIAAQLEQLIPTIETHNEFVSWIDQTTKKLYGLAQGIFSSEVIKTPGYASAEEYFKKETEKYLKTLTSPEVVKRLTMLREGLPDVLSTIEQIRDTINEEISKTRNQLNAIFPVHDMPQLQSVTFSPHREQPIHPTHYSFEDWEKIMKNSPEYQFYSKRLDWLTNVRDKFNSIVNLIKGPFKYVSDCIDRLSVWQEPEVKDLPDWLSKLYTKASESQIAATGRITKDMSYEDQSKIYEEEFNKRRSDIEDILQKIENVVTKRIMIGTLEKYMDFVGLLPESLKKLTELYASVR